MRKKISRRNFLKKGSCGAMGSLTLFSSLLNLGTMNALAGTSASANDYKALVCIQLSGGNDSFNMLVPKTDRYYKAYKDTRSWVAHSKEKLLTLNGIRADEKEYGLHPSMLGLQQLYNDKKVAFLANVGTLREKYDTIADIQADSSKLPIALMDHLEQAIQWQTSMPDQFSNLKANTGWGGRVAEIIRETGLNNPEISMNISYDGQNTFLAGNEIFEYNILPKAGPLPIEEYYDTNHLQQLQRATIDGLFNEYYANVFKQTYDDVLRGAIYQNQAFASVLDNAETLETEFDDTDLSQSLLSAIKIIGKRDKLGMKRQIFFISLDDFDTHSDMLERHSTQLKTLDDALTSFYKALEEIGMQDQVTTFTISEFGRSLIPNSSGTDHAWGGHHIIMGGAVEGGQIYGEYPSLEKQNNPLLIYGSAMIPTTSTDEYFGELAQWFGVRAGDLEYVLPNIKRFYSPTTGQGPLGFMNR